MSTPPHDPLLNARRTGDTRHGFATQYHNVERCDAERPLSAEGLPWYVTYRVRVGVK